MIGLALSGGGVRSAAQLGIVQVLHEEGIKPSVFAGTSGGSIVAALLAFGYDPHLALGEYKKSSNLLDLAIAHMLKGVLTRRGIKGIYKGQKLEDALSRSFCNSTFDYPVNLLGIVSTDITSGRQIVFTNDCAIRTSLIHDDNLVAICDLNVPISAAVSASCRIPGVFIPKAMGPYTLVDGGITNNLPSDVARALGADTVISIDLGYAGRTTMPNGMYGIMKTSMEIMMERIVDINQDAYGIYLNPEIFDVNVLDFSRADECFERGYAYGKKMIPTFLTTLRGM